MGEYLEFEYENTTYTPSKNSIVCMIDLKELYTPPIFKEHIIIVRKSLYIRHNFSSDVFNLIGIEKNYTPHGALEILRQ